MEALAGALNKVGPLNPPTGDLFLYLQITIAYENRDTANTISFSAFSFFSDSKST
jgi:hypothetical protein